MGCRKHTTALLLKLRALMKDTSHISQPIHAYIIPSGDAHLSEYIAASDGRRAFITGFTGSAGTAVVTASEAALWTDSRYFLQAQDEMDENWTLMKDGLPDTLSQEDWLCKVLPPNSHVGVSPFLMAAGAWKPIKRKLGQDGHMLVPVQQNLVDLVWEDRPPQPCNPLTVLSLTYTGQSWKDKVKVVREKMEKKKAGMLVLSALDDVAWLFNLRGSDIDYNPVFFSYAIVTMTSVHLFLDERRLTMEVKEHLNVGPNGVTIHPYDSISTELTSLMELQKDRVWIAEKTTSHALYSLVPKARRVTDISPVCELKAVKNSTELSGMKRAHVKDAVALCEYFAWLEKEVPKGMLNEVTAADKLEKYRQQQDDFVGLSFPTISSSGPNGAVIHYQPEAESARQITTDEVYLCDSGSQFKDGTTDITRTVHFGIPSKHEQECFTRVLKGHIALCKVVFPNEVKGHRLDSLARLSLWEAGLDYLHGTGHGVGAYLNVHEGPIGISLKTRPEECVLKEGMILSDEPGYYEDGNFGIRIENLMAVTKATTKHNFQERGFLTFEVISLVPMQTKMMLPELLTQEEIAWLNKYHEQCRETVGLELKAQGRNDAYLWLHKETEPLG